VILSLAVIKSRENKNELWWLDKRNIIYNFFCCVARYLQEILE